MPIVAGIKQTFGLKSSLNVAAFATTMLVLVSTNVPMLRSVATEMAITGPSGHGDMAGFDIPVLNMSQPTVLALPAMPSPDDAEPIPRRPRIATPSLVGSARPKPANAVLFGLFGSLEFRTNATIGTGAWRQALARLDNEQPLYEFCDIGMLKCPPKYVAWRRLLAAIRSLPPNEQLSRLNRGVNALISHGNDADIFRVRDHWAAPMEFLQTGGDCEDYTILKYASLLELGYSDDQLRIAVVTDTRRRQDHAVLAVADRRGVTILDSLTDAPVPHERIRHYRPVYSVNRADRWVHIATKQISRLSVASISQ